MPKNKVEVTKEEVHTDTPPKTELDELKVLFKELKERGFNSIGDVENRIAFLQR